MYLSEIENPIKRVHLTGGLMLHPTKHRLVVIGGMPGTGKTTYCDSECALELARQGYTLVIFSYEMSEDSLFERILANAGEISLSQIENRKFDPIILNDVIHQTYQRIKKINIESPRNLDQISRKVDVIAEKVLAEESSYPKFVFIWDYLQRAGGTLHANTEDLRIRTAKTLSTIQDLNRKYDAISLVIASLNRTSYHATDLSCFKEAGEIESDADMAILMRLAKREKNRWIPLGAEEVWAERKKPVVNIKFDILKNRHGQESEFVLSFKKECQRFYEPKSDEEPTQLLSTAEKSGKKQKGEVDFGRFSAPW